MRRLMWWAARLYPGEWRERYGRELDVLIEDTGAGWPDLLDLVREAMVMQMSSVGFWKIAAAFTLAGALVSGAWSLTVPDRYVSSAVLRVGDGTLNHNESWRQLQAIRAKVFSRQSLSGLIQQQHLYEQERTREPLEEIVQSMRDNDLHAGQLDDTQFTVSFAHSDPAVAQATVNAVVSAIVDANLQVQPQTQPGLGVKLEVVKPAGLPTAPASPNRARMMQRGLFTGLMAGVVCGGLWSIVRGRRKWSLKRVAAFAAAGAAIGMGVAFLLPDEFVSTAVLRTSDPEQLSLAQHRAFSKESLTALIQRDGIYSKEVAAGHLDRAVEKMRNSAIRVQAVQSKKAFTVSFTYTDRYKAQLVTHDLVTQISVAMPAELLDPPSLAAAPSSPNRLVIVLFGITAGVLLGLAASRLRRPPVIATA